MTSERFPHIFLKEKPVRNDFSRPSESGPQAKKELPERDQKNHAKQLELAFDKAWDVADERQAVVKSVRQGCYVEFISAGTDIPVKSLEDRGRGIRLLNIRRVGPKNAEEIRAAVYIPKEQRMAFLRKLHAYALDSEPGKRPKHETLITQIEHISAAVLEDFWTDRNKPLPKDDPVWVEAWISQGDTAAIEGFRETLKKLDIAEHKDKPVLRFPERAVLLILASGAALSRLIAASDRIAEFRAAREVSTFFYEMENSEQAAWCEQLRERIVLPADDKVAVCILDHGVSRGHPLISPILREGDLHTYREEWGTADDDGHGTLMAGLVAYGDVHGALDSQGKIVLTHWLESAKILPPPPTKNKKHLWGHITAQGISRAELHAPNRRDSRTVCMAVTTEDACYDGQPSSWSAELDVLASALDGTRRRLIVVSAGNAHIDFADYPEANRLSPIQDPAQAWNVLTVGAFTQKCRIESSGYENHEPVAPAGGLSPHSTSSDSWNYKNWPIKPEIVLEGGNVSRAPDGSFSDPEDLRLLSTSHDLTKCHFWPFEATSAATAQAAWMAAKINAEYPDAWPETIRGLMVHSAKWTETLRKQFLPDETKTSYRKLIRACGYGVPDLDRARFCAESSLTLIAQQYIQPYVEIPGNSTPTSQMHLYRLPWPREQLMELGATQVEMRVTLSYFVEPAPDEIGWADRYRYPSHGFRFDLNAPGESEEEFKIRINTKARADKSDRPLTSAPSDHWVIGQQRNVGSVHSDIWKGNAADLASSNLISVSPLIGWWRERNHLGKVESKTRYSLIVSIETPPGMTEIYTPVSAQVGIPAPVPIVV